MPHLFNFWLKCFKNLKFSDQTEPPIHEMRSISISRRHLSNVRRCFVPNNKIKWKRKKKKKFAIQSRLVTLQILKKQFIFRTNSTYSKKEINMHIHKMSFLLSQLFFFQIFFCYQGYLFPSLKHWMVLANLQRTNGSRWTDQKTTHQGENKLKKI